MLKRLLPVICLLFILNSPSVAAQNCAANMATAADQVRTFYTNGVQRFNAHDLTGFMRQFAPDALMYTPTGWLRGSDAVNQRFADTFRQFPKVKMGITELNTHPVDSTHVIVDFVWQVFPIGAGPSFKGVGSGLYVCRDSVWQEVLEHETVTFTDPALQVPPGTK